MKGNEGPTGPRRLGPLAIAIGLALLPAAVGGAVMAVKNLRAPRPVSAALSTPSPAPLATRVPTPVSTDTPSPTPWVAPSSLPSTVAAGTPVIYYSSYGIIHDPTGAMRLNALGWNGASRGYVDIPGAATDDPKGKPQILQSPDGQRLVVMDDVYTAQGTRLYHLQVPGRRWQTQWADDGRHLCVADSQADANGLAWSVLVIGGTGRIEHTIALPHTTAGDSGWTLEACSITGDRVLAYLGVDASMPELLVSRISTGAPILHQDLCGDPRCTQAPMWSVATPDARWAAEAQPSSNVRMRDLLSGRVTSLHATGDVLALSHDGSRLLVDHRHGDGVSTVDLLDVHTGTVLWSHQMATPANGDVAVAPAGETLAVAWQPAETAVPPGETRVQPVPSTLTLLSAGAPVHPRDLVVSDVYSLWAWRF